MGETLYEALTSWESGAITSAEADSIPANASPRAHNTALASVGVGKAIFQKRRGCSTMFTTPITGSPAIIGQYEFRSNAAGVLTDYHLLISNTGRVDKMGTDGTLTTIDATGLTSGDYYPDFATANNLCFIVNGQDRKKYNGTALQTFGITRPTVGSMAAADGGAGLHSGTYELRVTFGNSSTGHESSISDTAAATVTVTNKSLNWTAVPVSADTQVDRRYLYIRNTATMANFYRAGTISDNSTTTATTSVLDANLTIVAPDTAENDPPPSGIKFLAWHRSRLFAADSTTLYYSKVGLPEAFDPESLESINPNDGQPITGLCIDGEVLIIFKAESTYGLFGDDPQSWVIRLVHPDVGCTSHRSIAGGGKLTCWWSDQGPQASGDIASGTFTPIGRDLIRTTVGPDTLNTDALTLIDAVHDIEHERILFAVPEVGQTRLTTILPFNYTIGRWESTKWDPMDVGSLGIAHDASDKPWVFLGGYAGQVFKFWNADNDGMRATNNAGATLTKSGTFVASATSHSTITDLTATFDTDGAGLIERRVVVVDSNGRQMGSTRPRISSNSGTVLTLATAVSGLTVGSTYTYYIGGPAFEVDTYWSDMGAPFGKKRYEFLYIQAKATSSIVTVYVDLAFNYDTSAGQAKALSFVTTATSAIWDSSLWDSAVYGTQAGVNKRLRVGRTGRCWRARLRNFVPDQSVDLLKIGMRAEMLGDKIG